jgi:hypothetical protein
MLKIRNRADMVGKSVKESREGSVRRLLEAHTSQCHSVYRRIWFDQLSTRDCTYSFFLCSEPMGPPRYLWPSVDMRTSVPGKISSATTRRSGLIISQDLSARG